MPNKIILNMISSRLGPAPDEFSNAVRQLRGDEGKNLMHSRKTFEQG